ncbi:probable leucine-rich repeat receptor-like protein kinase At1g68400 [Elaeis guineensis]|uniref:Probable leucine-rich repeat receptor-like protein kinase At1g68400 n=1 Tax=Elaeis guineensis var. tenera TaxID=51953 RepID=A0A6I9QWE8_ELAGV|nr:probable leucine-rich repeat receptor-like protein kinase At1g68400 [Elaeis guineensis]
MEDKRKLQFFQRLLPPLLFLFFFEHSFGVEVSSSSFDGDLSTLLAFRALSDPAQKLASWNRSEPAPCSTWLGVSCAQGRVTRLVLEGLALSSPDALQALTRLDQLRVLSLKSNRLSGAVPDFSPLPALKLLFLSHNNLSGPIPPSISSLSRLYRLDLSHNSLSGSVPASLNRLSRLLTLRLDSNRLSGPISGLALPNLQDLNVSSNMLSGAIPPSLAAFPAAAFAGNPALCGTPLASCRDAVSDPSRPTDNSSAAAPVPPAAAVVASSPSSKPEVAPPSERHHPTPGRMSRVAVVAIVVGDFAVLVIVSGLLFCYFWRKFARKNPSRLHEGEKIVYSSSPYASQGGGATGTAGGGFERGRMVFLDDAKRFELEDLLRASAEMLGKGGYGTAYKAVLDDGSIVAVKRLRDVQVAGKREFEHHMEALGRLRHPNLVPLKAYYSARDEKLLVYEYMPNGSLYSLLHGNRGPGRTPLDWTTRMRIAAGAARGLAFIHHASKAPKLAHGNIKSSNILIDKTGNARLADFGLALLGPAAAARYGGYRSPEAPADGRRPWSSQRADVYAFGVVLLELLTGKPAADGGGGVIDLPRWVQSVVREEWTAEVFDLELMRYKGIEEELVGTLQIAMGCTATSPDQRPRIGHVVKMIEEIRGEVSPSLESFDSVSDSPSASEDASATTAGVASQ